MSLKIGFKNQSFYKKHLDLTPRNVYLASGRVMSKKEVDKTLNRIAREASWDSFKNSIKEFFGKIFKKGDK